jgi:hypothetical protein
MMTLKEPYGSLEQRPEKKKTKGSNYPPISNQSILINSRIKYILKNKFNK